MSLEGTRRQKSEQLELALGDWGEAPTVESSGEVPTATSGEGRSGSDRHLMEAVVERANARTALSPGIDGMTVEELPAYLVANWIRIREELLAGTFRPQPVKQQMIPKPGGGMRQLGIPTVLDRFIQQCLLQVLQPRFDPGFSEHSYGFRHIALPNRVYDALGVPRLDA